jgi:hypothetical protein
MHKKEEKTRADCPRTKTLYAAACKEVIDRKRIFLFRPKTNIRQENAAEYSADNEYWAQGSKYGKNDNHYQEKNCLCKVAVA